MTILYETAAALAMTAADLADAIDDERHGWPILAEQARGLLNTLTARAHGHVIEPEVDAIAARAATAPGGTWTDEGDRIWVPWSALDDAGPFRDGDDGRYIGVLPGYWHGTTEPPGELWEFLAAARHDVLTLAAEVRRLRAALATAAPNGQWACQQCADAWFGTPPDDGLCPGCRARGQVAAVTPAEAAVRLL
jgi:hypothetical protein